MDNPIAIIVIIAIIGLPLLYMIAAYNGLVTLRNHIKDAWANIDTELKRRYDLIPNLVETVKGYASHERGTLEAVVQARNALGTIPSGAFILFHGDAWDFDYDWVRDPAGNPHMPNGAYLTARDWAKVARREELFGRPQGAH